MTGTPMAFFQGEIMPLADAKIGLMTHAFNYGTAVFEGIRANWSAEHEQLYIFRSEDHIKRLRKSAHILEMELRYSDAEIVETIQNMVEQTGFREDLYIRPLVYKSQEVLGVRLHDVEDDFLIYCSPFGAYLDVDAGIRCCTSSWRRVDDTAIPARAKVTGIYVNSALAKTEAFHRGYDEAIMLSNDGHVSEGSGENIFMVLDGVMYTPPPQDNILVGITRATAIEMAEKELGIKTVERSIDRSELYIADEVFMTGTAAHCTPILEIDDRKIGDGEIGKVSGQIQKLYFDAMLGRLPQYDHWIEGVYSGSPVKA
ncbi:MAG TPA: branched-chain amino acid transaminase [Dehalococcoidia bacterium]|nr:branched-chain amino acid transaminase [Dehalococcoidia bacterium]